MTNNTIALEQTNEKAVFPKRATPGASGYDLTCVDNIVLYPGEFKMIPTGWNIAMTPDMEVQVRPRSGLAAKFGVTVLNSPGTVDSDYTGPLNVILINHGSTKVELKPGDRIAQMVPSALGTFVTNDQYTFDKLKEAAHNRSDRGNGGFGSTGS